MDCYDLGQYVVGKTPVLEDEIRGKEIKNFIDVHFTNTSSPLESFVILDDDDDMGELMGQLVQCKDYSGLSDDRREEAISLLNKGDNGG
jgi:hypothetical protein